MTEAEKREAWLDLDHLQSRLLEAVEDLQAAVRRYGLSGSEFAAAVDKADEACSDAFVCLYSCNNLDETPRLSLMIFGGTRR